MRAAEELTDMMIRGASLAMAGVLLASCVAQTARSGPFGDNRKLQNYSPYSVAFYEVLLADRVWIFESVDRRYADIPHAQIFRADGTVLECMGERRLDGKFHWIGEAPGKWSVVWGGHGATVKYTARQTKPRFARFFYDPADGAADVEIFQDDPRGRRSWERWPGWVQDTFPRSLKDGCPNLRLPPGMKINEKQTSLKFEKLRRQDPDAPVRNFSGSEWTAPGRTGLGASNLLPTTKQEAVWAFLDAQEGNILLNPKGSGRVFVRGAGTEHEIWRLHDEDGTVTAVRTMRETTDERGEWLDIVDRTGKVRARYPMGYPFPYLPTGYRHAAFQLTDALIESGEPVVLPWMPKEWKDFAFRANGTVLARRANGGPDRLAPWRWTKARLWVQIGGNREAPGWEEVAEQLGMETPKLWTPADGQRIEVASAEPATSGTGKCVGDHEGVATWTLGADGKRVWDTSGCRRVK